MGPSNRAANGRALPRQILQHVELRRQLAADGREPFLDIAPEDSDQFYGAIEHAGAEYGLCLRITQPGLGEPIGGVDKLATHRNQLAERYGGLADLTQVRRFSSMTATIKH